MADDLPPPGSTTRSSQDDEFATVPPRDDLPRLETPPDVFGYELFEEIGRGGTGNVVRALRVADRVEVAVKFIALSPGLSAGERDRFLDEARFLAQLTHPNIVPFYEAGVRGDAVYLVLQLANRLDARKRLDRKGPLRVHEAARLVRHVLAALHYAHRMGVVHRDVKPSNVLIHSERGEKRAKLADFGLAYAYGTSGVAGPAPTGPVVGTPTFMAPEAILDHRAAGPKADQYSAAATMYYLLTRKTVRETTDPPEQEPTPIRALRRDVHHDLAAALHKALSPRPEDRFDDVDDFKTALRPWAEA